jgi:hypothetical protein
MTNPILRCTNRRERRALLDREARARKSGQWGDWEVLSFPVGTVASSGWPSEITTAYRNRVFAVLIRSAGGGVVHYAISSLSDRRPTWWEMQRIKNELAGSAATAVEVYPPNSDIVDDADMFHIWVLPAGLPFGLRHRSGEGA